MTFADHWRCLACGATYPLQTAMNLCPVDQRPVEMVLDLARLTRERPDTSWYSPQRRSMWRFGGLLALDWDDASDWRHIVSLGEGCTPLMDYAHPAARRWGFRLRLKDEGMPRAGFGSNPTLSFKDRGMSMAVSMARRYGLRRLVVPTQGNAGDSLAAFARAAGLEAAIVMPDDTPMAVLGRVAGLSRLHPAITLDLIQGTIREAGQRVKTEYLPQGYFSLATFVEPGWRLEGKKTLGLELAEPQAGQTRWQLPDVIVYPTGGGTGILGMWKAFDELQALGLIGSERPRMVSVQAAATAPLVRAFENGDEDTETACAGQTLACGLNVAGGVGHFRVLEILRQSGGCALPVTEAEIGRELAAAWRDSRCWLCPEGAAALAALEKLVDRGCVRKGEDVVVVNTASLEKYLPEVRDLLQEPP